MSFCGWIKSAWDILHLIDTFFLYSLWTEAYRFLFFYYKRKGALFLSGRGYDQHYLSDLFLYSKTEIKRFLILPNNQSDDSKDYDDYIDDNKPMILHAWNIHIKITTCNWKQWRQQSLPHSPGSFLFIWQIKPLKSWKYS